VIRETNRSLADLCLSDLLAAFKLKRGWAPLAYPASRIFASRLAAFDRLVQEEGLVAAGRLLLSQFTSGVETAGPPKAAATGPLIVVSNHPGLTDAMAVWTSLGREDLKILAAERDLLHHLPHLSEKLILIRPTCLAPLRGAMAHLKSGGAILTFPAGRIEPDPSLRPGALESLRSWSPSMASLAKRVPGTRILPAFVQGVLTPSAARNPLCWPFSNQKDRDWAAATLQIILPWERDARVSVAFGAPVGPDVLEVRREMTRLMAGAPFA
jgi:hypothetical protein